MRYDPRLGGHAPGHLRDAFTEWVEDDGAESATVPVGSAGDERSTEWLIGQLWNCCDCMPRDLCAELNLPQGSTYAQGVRSLHMGSVAG